MSMGSGNQEGTGEERGERPAGSRNAPSGPVTGVAALRVLRQREFAIFWVGNLISLTGTWMQAFAQGWVVTSLTASAWALGLVNFFSSIPTLVLMPFGGVAADRGDRRRILIWSQWVMLVLAAVMGALVATRRLEVWHIYVIALLLGIVTAFDLPAFQAFYPELVEPEEMSQAITLNQSAFHGSRIIGPAVAGWMVARWGAAAAFFANSASFLAVIASLLLIRPRPRRAGAAHGSTLSFMREGLRYVRERPDLQALLGLTGVTSFCIFPNMAVLTPYYANHVLNVGAAGLGSLMSVSGLGSLLGSILLLTSPREQRYARMLLAAATITVTASVLAWSQYLWLSVGVMAFQSLAISTSLGLSSIIVQEMVPNELRGRVMSLYTLMFTGVIPFSSLLLTAVVDWIGMRWELQIAAVLYALGSFLLLGRLARVRESSAVTASLGDASPSPVED